MPFVFIYDLLRHHRAANIEVESPVWLNAMTGAVRTLSWTISSNIPNTIPYGEGQKEYCGTQATPRGRGVHGHWSYVPEEVPYLWAPSTRTPKSEGRGARKADVDWKTDGCTNIPKYKAL
jgi:hypothetical protein